MESLPFDRTWLPYLYLYGVGGILFLVGIFITLRNKAINLAFRQHRKWLFVLFGGFVWYALIHAVLILLGLGGH
jgi:uncharacterized membrane protein